MLGLAPSASRGQVKDAFRKLCLVYHPDKCSPDRVHVAEAKFKSIKDAYDTILKGVNWAAVGMVTPVRNQGSCGSCAHTRTHPLPHQGSCGSCAHHVATALVESTLLISGQGSAGSVDLSEQSLVSCVNPTNSPYNGYGCGGSWIDNNLNYVRWLGQVKESAWRYSNSNDVCDGRKADATKLASGQAVSLTNAAVRVSPYNSADGLKAALLLGPVGINLYADSAFMSYRGGIYDSPTCPTSTINHAVTLIGYDYDTVTSQWYWLIKNSWGTNWGENGYGRLAMYGNGYGLCAMYRWSYRTADARFSSVAMSSGFSRRML
ncbi:hypothetical protein FOA52_007250 [Chlamydomonas sp. UWO 241]|nr:hypothetical protein FOA52_007250 [Chlamydomonas sp. UWO 241]